MIPRKIKSEFKSLFPINTMWLYGVCCPISNHIGGEGET